MSNKHSTGLPPNSGKVQHVKLVLLGDQGVGKSSIALRFVRGEFYENNEATVGAAFLTQTVNVGEHAIKFDIWDTAGQERYHSLAPMYYRGAHAAIVVYDVTSTGSYARAVSWVKELRQLANSQITIVLAGNKADMAPDSRTVATDEAKIFSDNNELGFFEASAKTGMSVHDMFMFLATKLARLNQGGTVDHRRGIQLNNKQRVKNSKKCC